MTRRFIPFFFMILGICLLSLTYFQHGLDKETLVLFVAKERPILSEEELEDIEGLAKEMSIQFIIHNSADGIPTGVTTLPSLYFQNRKGRSKYYGRYSNIPRLKNFIRTSKLAHQKNEAHEKKHLFVWKEGRADVSAPLKLTELTGSVPPDFDQAAFEEMAKKALADGMQFFKLEDTHLTTKNTRSFYFNIYPYLSESNELSLSTEVFSQYNCVKPVFTQDIPIAQSKWAEKEVAFKQAGKFVEEEILRQIKYSEAGDAFQPVSNKVKEISWEGMGLGDALDMDEQVERKVVKEFEFARSWKVEQRENKEEPIIIYHFLSPVDNYAGEVKELAGVMELSKNGSMEGATGKFVVDIGDVTMGSDDFDKEVHYKMLNRKSFPEASFEFVRVNGVKDELKLGVSQKMEVEGVFTMMGIPIPIVVDTEIEPFMAKNDVPKLQVNCTFQLPLFEKFNVEGPDGPSPAKDVLQFYMQFNLEVN